MKSSFPWIPVGTEVNDGIPIGRVVGEGIDYQIITVRSQPKCILLIRHDAKWIRPHNGVESQIDPLMQDGVLAEYVFGEIRFWVGIFEQDEALVKVGNISKLPSFGSSDQLLEFAKAISVMNEQYGGAIWSEAIYLPRQNLCLAVEFDSHGEDRKALALKLLTGGVQDPSLSPKQIKALNPWMTVSEIEKFFSVLDLEWNTKTVPFEKRVQKPEDFSLAGRPRLEAFFKEHIIDYFHRRAEYEAMGIVPPNGILLSGPPGTGKTYAVQKLAEFLGWPVYDIDIATVGSPYIHQTSKTLGHIFDTAAKNAPSIVLMEEIDALAGDRDESRHSHKIEEVTQLLRLIEKAAAQGILVIATSTRLYAMDEAITRRGRFDHIIDVEIPKVNEISAALEALLSERPTVGGLNIDDVATKLKGRTMSDFVWVVNEAARIAVKSEKKQIDDFCFLGAVRNFENR